MKSKNVVLAIITFYVVFLKVAKSTVSDPQDGPSAQSDDGEDRPGEPLSSEDFRRAEKLPTNVPPKSGIDPIEKAGQFEGDIIVQERNNFTYSSSEKNAIVDPKHKWPNGVVPYTISSRFSEDDRTVIAKAILEFHRQTCITFKARSSEHDYVMITTGNGCSSSIGKVGGGQHLTLGEGCVYPGIVMHELMHSVGFWHEQSRWNRDEHVTVIFENIQPGMEENFQKVSWKEAQNLSAPYDTSSIMHYGPFAFSKNRQKGLKTIIPKVQNDRMGQRVNFSEVDVYKINKLYNCRKNNSEGSQQSTTTTQRPKNDSFVEADENCKDNHKHCKHWAGNGECDKNPDWMLVNCKKSCNQCSTVHTVFYILNI